MWIAWILDINYCDLWSPNGIIIDGWQNTDSPSPIHGMGERLARYTATGVTVVTYPNEAAYEQVRKQFRRT